ncbi:HTH-type transcriptional repressor NicS [Pandoraea iniqua]|uniref:HTH-type transcriptional repressor NicS n=1 Tax=Pandoraea iniqua TaxID=2508288 RepID=A0A5E4Y029_9BURK|nr:TetR/AcrR family transcriptional regulator [Pandoraea iniqua]VVE41638.1 HTH-type transcriptional repressor NicS [Pandoraea iniqua]
MKSSTSSGRVSSADKAGAATTPRGADATRARILDAARLLFSQNSYEGVGVREIASLAQADPALVIRYFGSKEELFRAVVAMAFDTEDLLVGGIDALPKQATDMLMGTVDNEAWRASYDPLRLLLCSIGSPTAGPILGYYLDKDFLTPLSRALAGKHARERAALLGAQIIGFALMRVALSGSSTEPLQRTSLRKLLQESLATALKAI